MVVFRAEVYRNLATWTWHVGRFRCAHLYSWLLAAPPHTCSDKDVQSLDNVREVMVKLDLYISSSLKYQL
jgi:hypothetical protein